MSWKFTDEATLKTHFSTTIEDFWNTQVTQSTMTGKDGVTVHCAWCKPEDATDTVVISSGRIESLLKYKELIFDLYNNRLAVFILDHRGQGLSGRMTEDPQHGFVASFDDYVDDLLAFTDDIVTPHQAGNLYLLCHSMGGAIGALTLLRDPSRFDKAVLASPMFGVRPALPGWLANSLVHTGLAWNRLRNKQSGYFFGQTPYVAFPYTLNKLTHSKTRYEIFRQLYDEERQIQLGGVTSEWLHAAQVAMNRIEACAPQITTPTLIFSADGDAIIDNERQRRVAKRFADAQLEVVPEAYHELFTEADVYRDDVLNQVMRFFTA